MPTVIRSSRFLQCRAQAGRQGRPRFKLFRVAVSALVAIAPAACAGDPTGVPAPSGGSDLAPNMPASAPEPTASCVYVALSATEWQTRVDWSRYPVSSIEFFQGTLGGGSATETLTHARRRGTLFLTLGFPSTIVRLKDRRQEPLAVLTCVAST